MRNELQTHHNKTFKEKIIVKKMSLLQYLECGYLTGQLERSGRGLKESDQCEIKSKFYRIFMKHLNPREVKRGRGLIEMKVNDIEYEIKHPIAFLSGFCIGARKLPIKIILTSK